jgi:Kef-type K+ transport system membrane component KefB
VSPILQLLIVLVIVLVAAKASGMLAVRLGQPAVLGELIAGVVLGPTAIDLFGADFLDDPHLEETVLLLGELGVIFLMFLAGLETDLEEVGKVRRVALLAGTLGVALPIGLGAAGALPFGFSAKESVFVGIILAATSVSISARTLMELGVLQGRQGIAILAAAVIDDVLVILVLSFFIAFAVDDGGGGGAGEVVLIVLRVALFFTVAVAIGRFVLPWVARWSLNAPMSEGVATTAIVVVLLGAWFAEYVGEVALITGAFLAGVFLRPTEAHRVIDEKLHTVSYAFFVPVFFVAVGLSADAGGLSAEDLGLLAVISAVAVVSKLIGCGLGAYLAGEPLRSSLQIGAGMISRGEVGLIVASVGLTHGLIDSDLFSVMVLMVLATTLITPVVLRTAFAGEREERHVQSGRPDPA